MRRVLPVTAVCASLLGMSGSGWAAPCDLTVHEGVATYYEGNAEGVCGYPGDTANRMYVALDPTELQVTARCGACIHVWGPNADITVLVVNGCPGCQPEQIDLSPEAWDLIASGYNGVPPVTWQYVPCETTGPIRYAYFSGSSTAWAWVQVRNHVNPIATFEARMGDGNYAALERSDWGYFLAQNLPDGTQSYRVTDSYGQVLEDTGIAVLDEGEVSGQGQFPPCEGAGGGTGPGWGGSGQGGSAAGLGGSTPAPSAGSRDPSGDCGCRAASRLPSESAWGLVLLGGLLAIRRGTARRAVR